MYRVYSPVTNSYFLTTDSNEYNYLGTIGYRRDGILGVMLAPTAVAPPGTIGGVIPLFRLYSPALRVHFFTSDENEYTYLSRFAGYTGEGAIGKMFQTSSATTVPIYRAYSALLQRHIWTANVSELTDLIRSGVWVGEGIIGYVTR